MKGGFRRGGKRVTEAEGSQIAWVILPLRKNKYKIAAPNMHTQQQQQSDAHTVQDASPLPQHLPGWPVARGTAGTVLPAVTGRVIGSHPG